MRRIAGEDHAAVHVAVERAALESVHGSPDELEPRSRAEHCAQARHHTLGLPFLLDVGIRAELQIDAPHIVGLPVQQCGLTAVERRLEPEPPLRRKVGLHAHVGDQEFLGEHFSPKAEAQLPANGGTRAVAGDEPLAAKLVRTAGRADPEAHVIVEGLDAFARVLRADRAAEGAQAVEEHGLDVVLLQVHEGRHLVTLLGLQIEAVEKPVAMKHLARIPSDAPVADRLPRPQTVPYFEAALRMADGPRSFARRMLLQHEGRNAAAREIDRERQPHRPGADDDYRMMAGHPSSASHIWRSRSAVQMRGSATPPASSQARLTSNGMQWSKIANAPNRGRRRSHVSR